MMRVSIDTEQASMRVEESGTCRELPLFGEESFDMLSELWLKTGWALKYSYGFTWLGRPVIQLPEDLVRIQEVLYRVQPDVLVETGVAHGGSLIFYASLFRAIGKGRVVGVDIQIRPQNRQAIESHPLASLVTLIEGSSTDPAVVKRVRSLVEPGERVLVILDSDHSKSHVTAELESYAGLVSPGSYLVVTDGFMGQVGDVPGGFPGWAKDNPAEAATEFLSGHPEFELDESLFLFNEGKVRSHVTYWPHAYLRKLR